MPKDTKSKKKPAPEIVEVGSLAKKPKHRLPALDYDGPPLSLQVAERLRARFAPKDETKTVWF